MFSLGVISRICCSYLFRIIPVKKNKIFCSNFGGRGYGDNPKYICEYLLASPGKYEIVWEVNNMDEKMPIGIRKVKRLSFRSIYEATTSKIWIDDVRKSIWFKKRKNQLYIQTWHGGIGFKKAEAASANALSESYVIQAKRDSEMIDCLLSGSKWGTRVFSKGFWYDGPILKTGLPRQDILIDLNEEKKKKIRKKMGISDKDNIILYAPTFRKDMTEYSIYDLDWEKLINALHKRFDGKWIGAIRLHPGLTIKYGSKDKRILDLSSYPDSQEVLAASDIVITDYSSVIFDFALTGKPAFIYAPDLDEYRKDRDVYFDFDSIPFPYADTQEKLFQKISSFDVEKYNAVIKTFIYDECGVYPIHNASANVCTIINNYINGKIPYYDQSLVEDTESI